MSYSARVNSVKRQSTTNRSSSHDQNTEHTLQDKNITLVQLRVLALHGSSHSDHTYRKMMLSRSNGYSMIPVVGTRTRRISCSVGKQSGLAICSMLSRQLYTSNYTIRSVVTVKEFNTLSHQTPYNQDLYSVNLLQNKLNCRLFPCISSDRNVISVISK